MGWYGQFLKRFGFAGVLLTVLSLAYIILFLMYGLMGPAKFDAFFLTITLPSSPDRAVQQPWSVLTYWLVTHPLGFWFLLLDMVVLYAFGHILNAMIGDRRTQGIVVFAVVVNALLTIAFSNLIPLVEITPATRLAGFSAVNATLIAATITLVPRYNFRILFWDIPLVAVGIFLLLVSIASYRAFFTMAGVAEMSGALVGFLLMKVLKNGWNLTRWFQGVANRPQPQVPRRPEPVYSQQRPVVRSINPKQKSNNPAPTQPELSEDEELDLLLDRINEVGYSGLTSSEKARLDQLSGK